MKNDKDDVEQRLLNHASIDELIKIKMEEELKAVMENAKRNKEKKIISDIKKLPKKVIFGKKSVYRVFNKINHTESFINGLQADALLGLQKSIREKILSGDMDAFSTEDMYVKFEQAEVID